MLQILVVVVYSRAIPILTIFLLDLLLLELLNLLDRLRPLLLLLCLDLARRPPPGPRRGLHPKHLRAALAVLHDDERDDDRDPVEYV